jgi:hypothetical protein
MFSRNGFHDIANPGKIVNSSLNVINFPCVRLRHRPREIAVGVVTLRPLTLKTF